METQHRKILSKQRLKTWVGIAVKQNFLQIGNELVLQICGIPMGMNAASFLSNMYLFMYELLFMEQFLQGGAEAIAFFIANFRFIMRYQDDRWAGNSAYLQRSMYNNQFWGTQDDDRVQLYDKKTDAAGRPNLSWHLRPSRGRCVTRITKS